MIPRETDPAARLAWLTMIIEATERAERLLDRLDGEADD
jgi:hypothetical protein